MAGESFGGGLGSSHEKVPEVEEDADEDEAVLAEVEEGSGDGEVRKWRVGSSAPSGICLGRWWCL